MGWTNKLLKMVGFGNNNAMPIPQHFSDKIDDFEVQKGEDGALFTKVQNFPVSQGVQINGADTAIPTKAVPIADIASGSLVITASALELKAGASALTNRKQIILYPPDAGTVYWGKSGVTSATGAPFKSTDPPLYFDVDAGSPKLYAVNDGTNRTVRVVESS
jgi:hypothetical protein